MFRFFSCFGIAFLLGIAQLSFSQDKLLVESKPAVGIRTEKSIRVMEQRIERNQNDYFGYAALGKLYYKRARQTGIIRFYAKAEEGLRKALEIRPDYDPAIVDLASVYAALHRFPEALTLAGKIHAKYPDNLEALATMADALLELGEYEKASEICKELIGKFPGDPAIIARQAHLDELSGHPDRALQRIQEAAEKAKSLGVSAENLAWYHARLGDLYFHTRDLAEAEKAFQESTRIFQDYYIGLIGLGDVREAQGRIQEAIALYTKAVAMNPSAATLIALGDLYSDSGQLEKANACHEQAENMLTQSPLLLSVFSRELALFYSDRDVNVEKALEIAQADMAVRKDIGGFDTLAWALYRNKRFPEAEDAILEALRLNTKEPDFFIHAAYIFHATGKRRKSQEYLMQAQSMWPYLVPKESLWLLNTEEK